MLNRIRNIARETLAKAQDVKINDAALVELVASLQDKDTSWPAKGPVIINGHELNLANTFIYELTANSVNFCYWLGRADVRPGGASARAMYDLLDLAWQQSNDWSEVTAYFTSAMRRACFPLWRERRICLAELTMNGQAIGYTAEQFAAGNMRSAAGIVEWLGLSFGNFGSDVFLKRAQLFAFALHRRFGVFDDISLLTVPVDYQLPNVLRAMGVLQYSEQLAATVDRGDLITSGSRQELEIRSATLAVCGEISKRTGLGPVEVDNFLWRNRKSAKTPHHCTITTDY